VTVRTVQFNDRRIAIEERWSNRKDDFARLGAQVDGARIVDAFLADLRELRESEDGDRLTLSVAASISGYSKDHLARLIRRGILPNSGRKNRPLLMRKHVPKKPNNSLARATDSGYDAVADARALRERQGER
jgi:hypothetical protein